MNARDKSGVGYLLGEQSNAPNSNSASPSLQTAIALGLTVLQVLRERTDGAARMRELVDAVKIDLDRLKPIIDALVGQHLLRYVDTEKYGNHLVEMTQDARNLFST